MGKTRVGIIFGGRSAEHEVSLQSAKNILDALDKERFDVSLIGIDKQGHWHLSDPQQFLLNPGDPAKIALNRSGNALAVLPGREQAQLVPSDPATALAQIDVVFPIVHGTLGEDGSLQGLLRMANLPFVGSGVLGSAVAMDKDVAKRLLRDAGLPVAPFVCFSRATAASADYAALVAQLGTPLFVKPANQGSSGGREQGARCRRVRPGDGAGAVLRPQGAGGIGHRRPRDRVRGAGQRPPRGQRLRRGGSARRLLRLRHQVHQRQRRRDGDPGPTSRPRRRSASAASPSAPTRRWTAPAWPGWTCS